MLKCKKIKNEFLFNSKFKWKINNYNLNESQRINNNYNIFISEESFQNILFFNEENDIIKRKVK